MATFGDVSTGLGAVRRAANSNKDVAGLMAGLMGLGQVGSLLSRYGQYQREQAQEKRAKQQHAMAQKRFDAAMEEMLYQKGLRDTKEKRAKKQHEMSVAKHEAAMETSGYQKGRRPVQEEFEEIRLRELGYSETDAKNTAKAKTQIGILLNKYGPKATFSNMNKLIKDEEMEVTPAVRTAMTNLATRFSGQQRTGTGRFGTSEKTIEDITQPRDRIDSYKVNKALTPEILQAETINALTKSIYPAFAKGGSVKETFRSEGFDKGVKAVRAMLDVKNLGPDLRRSIKSYAFAKFLTIAQDVPGKNRRAGDDSLIGGEFDEWNPETIDRIKKEIERRWDKGDKTAPLALMVWNDEGKFDKEAMKEWQKKDLTATYLSSGKERGLSNQQLFSGYGEVGRWAGLTPDAQKNPNVVRKGGQYYFKPPGVDIGGVLQRPQDLGTGKGFVRQGTLQYNPTIPMGMAKGAETPATEYLKANLTPLSKDFNSVLLAAEMLKKQAFADRLAKNPNKTREQLIAEFKDAGAGSDDLFKKFGEAKKGEEITEEDLFAEFVRRELGTKKIPPFGTKTKRRTGFYTTEGDDQTVNLTRENAKLTPTQAYRAGKQQYMSQLAGRVVALAQWLARKDRIEKANANARK